MTRATFLEELHRDKTDCKEEQDFVPLFIDILSIPNAYKRSLLDRHLTASAWIMHPHDSRVLLLHHVKLARWLQPGGHADGEENLYRVALKEANEETGLFQLKLLGKSFFDLDIHRIPERSGVPAHDHYDVRFAFVAKDYDQIQKNHESNTVQWIDCERVSEITDNELSITRMLYKSMQLSAEH
jgi:8-oxo-dGTP pyrophosphatase MutT (NUDIX family)